MVNHTTKPINASINDVSIMTIFFDFPDYLNDPYGQSVALNVLGGTRLACLVFT